MKILTKIILISCVIIGTNSMAAKQPGDTCNGHCSTSDAPFCSDVGSCHCLNGKLFGTNWVPGGGLTC